MALKIDTYSTSDGSVQAPKQVPDSLEKLLDNAADVPSNSKTPLRQYFDFPALGGAGTASQTWVAPFDCTIMFVGGYKPAGTGGVGDKLEFKNGSNVISTIDIATITAPAALPGTLVYTYRQVSAGDVITALQTEGAGAADSSVVGFFDIIPQ